MITHDADLAPYVEEMSLIPQNTTCRIIDDLTSMGAGSTALVGASTHLASINLAYRIEKYDNHSSSTGASLRKVRRHMSTEQSK